MKTTSSILLLALSIATPATAACLYASQSLSPDILSGCFTFGGLLLIAATDYSPRRSLALPETTRKTSARWTGRSLTRTGRFPRTVREEKIAA